MLIGSRKLRIVNQSKRSSIIIGSTLRARHLAAVALTPPAPIVHHLSQAHKAGSIVLSNVLMESPARLPTPAHHPTCLARPPRHPLHTLLPIHPHHPPLPAHVPLLLLMEAASKDVTSTAPIIPPWNPATQRKAAFTANLGMFPRFPRRLSSAVSRIHAIMSTVALHPAAVAVLNRGASPAVVPLPNTPLSK